MAKNERADVHAPLTLAQDRVPHGRRVAGSPAREATRPQRDAAVRRDAGLQLALVATLTGVGVDEEQGHGARG